MDCLRREETPRGEMMWGPVEERLLNGRLGKVIAQVGENPGASAWPGSYPRSIVNQRFSDIWISKESPAAVV